MWQMFFPVATLGAGVSNAADYEQYGYDTVGNRTSLRKRDTTTITYGHDGLNRVRTMTVPVSATGAAGYVVDYGYDVRGLQLFARFRSTGAGITNQYDGFGWLRSSSTNMDGTPRPVTYAYDAHGNRTRVAHPDGNFFEYAYEATDNLKFVYENGPGSELINNSFDAFGRRELISRNTGGGSTTAILFDEISRLKSIGHNLDGTATGNDVAITTSKVLICNVFRASPTDYRVRFFPENG